MDPSKIKMISKDFGKAQEIALSLTSEGYHIDRYASLYDEIIFLLHHKNGNRMRVVAKSGKTYLIKNGKIIKIV